MFERNIRTDHRLQNGEKDQRGRNGLEHANDQLTKLTKRRIVDETKKITFRTENGAQG